MSLNILKYLVSIGLLFLLDGCTIFPNYSKPAVKTPDSWQATLPHDGQLSNLNHWWDQFNDPVLSSLIETSEINSPTLSKALAAIQAARANVVIAGAADYPSLSGKVTASRSKNSFSNGSQSTGASSASFGSTNATTSTWMANLDASWEIDLFGGIGFSRESAVNQLEAKKDNWFSARVSLAAEVATDYLDYRACQLSANAYRQALKSKEETSRLTHILANAGFSSPADAALAEASLRSTESSLIAQQASCDITVKTLVALTDMKEADLRNWLAKDDKLPQPAEFVVDSIPASVVLQRPDLMADERNLASASAEIGVSKANLYPSLSLTGSIGRMNTSIGNYSADYNTWSFGPSINIPIFNHGELKAKVKVSEANYLSALATYQEDTRNAIKEVEQALVNLESAASRETSERVSTEDYEKYFKAAEINWRAGGISLLTLEDARRQLIDAQLSHISQQHDRVKYWIALYKALGGGWQESRLPDADTLTGPTQANQMSVWISSKNIKNGNENE